MPDPAPTSARLPECKLLLAGAPLLQRSGASPLQLSPLDALLLVWLALEGPTARGRLATLLWPDSDAEAARNSLRQRLFKLRRHCGVELVSGTHTLALAADVGHDLADAESLLATEPVVVAGELAAWLEQQRRRRQERLLQQLQARCEAAEQSGAWAEALALAQELLALVPCSEAAHRRVMRLHYLAGDRAAALLAFDRCERVLKDEVGTRPDAETLALLRLVEGAAAATAPARRGRAPLPTSVLRPPRLVGREAEIHAADHAWARGQVVALVGEAGMGKSRLLQHLMPAQGLAVAARPGDAGVPLSTLARLLRAVAERVPQAVAATVGHELARVLPEWLPTLPPALPSAWHGAATPGGGHRLQLQRTVAAVLAGCADLPALALDDLHFADAASLQLLQALLDEAPGPQRWALAYRPAEAGSALHALNESLLDQARLQAVALAPLDEGALATLVDSLQLPGVDGARLAPGLLARTGGNPLYALETLKQAWVDEQLAGGEGLTALADARTLPRPLSVLRLVEKRLAQLSPAALALARCVAVAGQDFSPALATKVLGTPTLALADAWAELESAQILRDQAFVHDLFQEAALASVPVALARHLHGEIAAHLEHNGHAAPARLARHWLDASQPDRAAPHLERAAQDAARALEPAEAARLWGQLAELRAAAGLAEAAFDAAEQAVLLLRSATAGADLEAAITRMQKLAQTALQHARGHDMRAVMLHIRGDVKGAAASVALALATLGPQGPWQARADLLNMQGVVLRRSGNIAAARAAFEQGLALHRQAAEASPVPDDADAEADGSAIAPTLNNLGLLLQDEDDHVGAITLLQEAAERQTDPLVRARVMNNLAISLEARGQAGLAYERCLSAARLAGGAAGVVAIGLAVRLGVISRTLGRWREALAHLDEAEVLIRASPGMREEELHQHRTVLWLTLGRPALAQEALERAAALCAALPVAAAEVATLRARLALALGQDALAGLLPAQAALQAAGQWRALRRLHLVQAQSLLALQRPDEALALMQTVAEEATVRSNACAALPVEVRLAQALLALQRPAEALRHAQRAADWLQALHPLEITPAEVWLTLARCAEAAGDSSQAASTASQGAALVQQQASQHVEPIYRESFLLRNPVHRELLLRAGRQQDELKPPSALPGP